MVRTAVEGPASSSWEMRLLSLYFLNLCTSPCLCPTGDCTDPQQVIMAKNLEQAGI